jgi:hypothetical protein
VPARKERFQIFISCSASQTNVARVLERTLLHLLVGDVELFLSTGMETQGSQSMVQIRAAIQQADMFLLLVTPGTASQSHSGFELGLFNASMQEARSEKRALALYSPDAQVPAMLADVKSVRAIPEEIEEWLVQLFALVRDRVRSVDLQSIRESSVRISEAFRQAAETETAIAGRAPDELKIKFELPSSSTRRLPNDSIVSSTSMEIFGLQSRRRWTWEIYADHVRNDRLNPEWPTELEAACIDFASGGLPLFKRTYRSIYSRKTYQPVIYGAMLANTTGQQGRSYTVTIHLIETPGSEFESTQIDDKLIFVVAAHNKETDVIYQSIQAAANSQNMTAQRVEDVVGDYRITDRIIDMIRGARLVLCDLSFDRPNVYFELGFARGIGKEVITIAREGSNIHFDVKDWTCIFYSDSHQLEQKLRDRFQHELSNK